MLVESALKKAFKIKNDKRKVCILGSTGSIGTSTLKVIDLHPDKFEVYALVAGSNSDLLNKQVQKYKPKYAALAEKHSSDDNTATNFIFGQQAINELVTDPEIDLVITAISGNAGLSSTLSAVKAGKFIALANKESLVCAGKLIADLVKKTNAIIVPVDSEHSALFQVMQAENFKDIKKLILTASGGPFLNYTSDQLANVTLEQALKHPRWNMGAKISLDSATLVNKAFEFIEAHWLFGISSSQIDVLVHPQSIIHSLVEYTDGTQLAQLSETNMTGAIAYALNYPKGRLSEVLKTLRLEEYGKLEFYALDDNNFKAINLAKHALQIGGNASMIYSLANEIALSRFIKNEISFNQITNFIERAMHQFSEPELSVSLDNLLEYMNEINSQLIHFK
jgi:1-deoxy-D-xylulose-5-phosphate reductoisomerase